MKETKYAGTQTEKNLMAAFAGESEARNKYTYFASKAKKEGYEQIAALFLKTADNEKEHAKLWFKELNGIGDTAENLLAAAEGENYEWTDMYDGFAKTADNIHEHQVEFMRCFEKQDGVAFILISYTHRNEYYYLTFKKLTEFWDRAAEGGRKSFRYEELEPAFFLPEVPGILVPYLNALQLDLNSRA